MKHFLIGSLRKVFSSLFVLVVVMSSMILLFQSFFLERISIRSMNNLQDKLIDSKRIETNAYARLIYEDLNAFQQSAYEFFNSASYRRILLALEQKRYTQQYLEDVQKAWYDLQIRQFSLSFIHSIDIYNIPLQKKMTPSSIIDMSAEESALLGQIVSGNNGVTIIDGKLYLWVGQRFSAEGTLNEMKAIAVADITDTTLRRYLAQYQSGERDERLGLYFTSGQDTLLLCALVRDDTSLPDLLPRDVMSVQSIEFYDQDSHYLSTRAGIGLGPLQLVVMTPWGFVSSELEKYREEIDRLRTLMLIAVLLSMTCILMMIYIPVFRLRSALRSIREDNLSVRLGHTWFMELKEVYSQFNQMAERIQNLIENEYRIRLLTTRAELRQLQYQMNPHFLYNTYFNLRALLDEEEIEKAAFFSDMLGRYLGYITHTDHKSVLKEEVDHAKVYAQIQHLRFADRLTLRFDELPEEARNITVPRLILQPLIENAYEHGIKSRLSGGIIQISYKLRKDMLLITVEDNGEEITDEKIASLQAQLAAADQLEPMSSIALVNIHKRLQLFYENQSCLIIARSPLGGLQASLCLMEVSAHVANSDG